MSEHAAPAPATAPTLADLLDIACRRWSDRPAISSSGETMTYAEFGAAATRLAAGYRRIGIDAGDRIVCQLPNGAEHIVAMGAAWMMGAVHIGVDRDLTLTELSAIVQRTKAAAVLMDDAACESATDTSRHLRRCHAQVRPIGAGRLGDAPEWYSLTALSEERGDPPAGALRPPAPEDAAIVFFTSGTTGEPKGSMGYHGTLARGWWWLIDELALTSADVHLVQLPLAHGFGLMMASVALFSGGCLVPVERFSPTEALTLVEREQITVLNGTPSHFNLVLKAFDPAIHEVSSLRIGVGSAATFSRPLLQGIFGVLGMNLLLLYGSSEGLCVYTSDRREMLDGSIGRPDPDWVAVMRSDGLPARTGELGEIVIRSWMPVSYLDDPDAATEEGSWYHTGDLGQLDSEGRLYVRGRVKHQINRGGQKVDPGEVEAALWKLDIVSDAAVIGVPDPVLGEVVCACIVPVREIQPSLDEVRESLRRTVARHKLPERLCVLDEIPRTPVGKVDREALRGRAQAAQSAPHP